jgi:hypothetical protein
MKNFLLYYMQKKAFNNIQYLFMLKTLETLEREGMFLN